MTTPSPPAHQAFAVFPAEALNFYAERAVEQQMAAHVLDRAAAPPLGWSDGAAELMMAET